MRFSFLADWSANYYLALAQALDVPIGPPQNLTIADGGAGGTLLAGTYFYKVTASDGVGGETTASNEVAITVAAGHQPVLTWNIVPNAASYNIYRGTASGSEVLIAGTGVPVAQNGFGSLTVTFTDTGSAVSMSTRLRPPF